MELEIKREDKVKEKGLLCDDRGCKKKAISLQWVNEVENFNLGIPFFLCKAHQDDVFGVYERTM